MSDAFAIDLGSAMTRVADERGQILFEEPTLAAIDLASGRMIAFGDEAVGLGARSGGRVALERPVRAGKLVDVELVEEVVLDVFRRVGVGRIEHPEVTVSTHLGTTEIQRRALERALHRAGARHIRFVEQPIAVAIAAGLAIAEPVGMMVVDVGGGTSDVGVMALGGLVSGRPVDVGGFDFDEAVRNVVARSHGLALDRRFAEILRRRVGTLSSAGTPTSIEITARDRRSGRSRSEVVSVAELTAALQRVVEPLFEAAVRCVTSAPPDLANDLLGTGVVLAGGGSLLPGLDQRLASAVGVPVHVPPEPTSLAVRGAARCLAGAEELTTALSAVGFG